MTAREKWRQIIGMFLPKGEPIWEQLARLSCAGMHRLFGQINDEFARLRLPHRINHGAAPLDGTGEPVEDALQKIRDNLRLIPGGRRLTDARGNDITHLVTAKKKNKKASSRHPLYNIWSGMHFRCRNKSDPRYGGRGIVVCEEWSDFGRFASDMGPRPSPKHSIDRKDNDGPYAPWNCQWATPIKQAQNTSTVKFIGAQGESACISEWARKLGITKSAMQERIRMYGVDVAISLGGRREGEYPQQNNKIGLRGVCEKKGRFIAEIRRHGRKEHLGSFDTAEEAHSAYQTARAEYRASIKPPVDLYAERNMT